MKCRVRKTLLALMLVYGLVAPYFVLADLTGGGTVTNTAPQIIKFEITYYNNSGVSEANYQQSSGTPTSSVNDDGGDYIEVNVTVYDSNGESDLIWINFSVDKTLEDGTAWMSHQISATDRSNSSHPGFNENSIHGYDNGTADNGYLTFAFKHTFDHGDDPANGALTSALYTWQVEIKDSAGSTATDSKSFKVYNYANLTLVQGYFAGDGSQNTSDTMWGNWSGTAGSTQTSKNYLKAQNIEATGNGNVSISWSWTTLNNSSSGGTIALTNVNYYEGEGVNASSVGSWGAVPTDANHQNAWVTVTNNPTGTTTSWTNYTISIPANTPTGTYTQSFTWSITT